MGLVAVAWTWSSYLFEPSLGSLSGNRLVAAIVASVILGLVLGAFALLPPAFAAVAAGVLATVAIFGLVVEGGLSNIGGSEVTWVAVGLLAFVAFSRRDT